MNELRIKGGEPDASPAAPTIPARSDPAQARAVVPGIGDEPSFGRALAAAREARGLSPGDVAAQLRLHTRQVRAIEAEDLGALPEGPFVRGYVRNYARLVDLAAEPLLALLDARLKPTDPLRTKGGTAGVSPLQREPHESLSGRIVVGATLAGLVIVAAFGWWAMRANEPVPASVGPPAPAATVPKDASAPTAAEQPAAGPPVQIVEEIAAAASDTALRLSFRDRSWVEIRQADGTVLLSQVNSAGTTRVVEGTPPYLVVIGNASNVDLEFRGQPVDLALSVSRDDVARLRLE